jgi:RNA polymerase sigma factor (sigma-70 family)
MARIGADPTDPELLALANEFLCQEWSTLRKMCEISARKSRGRDTWEEAMSEVAVRLPGWMCGWDPSLGRTLKSYTISMARWWLYKQFVWKRREREAGVREGSTSGDESMADAASRRSHAWASRAADGRQRESVSDDSAGREDADEVRYVLGAVSQADAAVLELYFLGGLTYTEVGEALGCTRSMAFRLVHDALEAARACTRTRG